MVASAVLFHRAAWKFPWWIASLLPFVQRKLKKVVPRHRRSHSAGTSRWSQATCDWLSVKSFIEAFNDPKLTYRFCCRLRICVERPEHEVVRQNEQHSSTERSEYAVVISPKFTEGEAISSGLRKQLDDVVCEKSEAEAESRRYRQDWKLSLLNFCFFTKPFSPISHPSSLCCQSYLLPIPLSYLALRLILDGSPTP